MEKQTRYRVVDVGAEVPDAVTVGIEAPGGRIAAAVWWPKKGDVEADEAEFDTVDAALYAAEAARVLHGFDEVVVAMDDRSQWRPEWGELAAEEPMGDLRGAGLTEAEAEELASRIEAERDA